MVIINPKRIPTFCVELAEKVVEDAINSLIAKVEKCATVTSKLVADSKAKEDLEVVAQDFQMKVMGKLEESIVWMEHATHLYRLVWKAHKAKPLDDLIQMDNRKTSDRNVRVFNRKLHAMCTNLRNLQKVLPGMTPCRPYEEYTAVILKVQVASFEFAACKDKLELLEVKLPRAKKNPAVVAVEFFRQKPSLEAMSCSTGFDYFLLEAEGRVATNQQNKRKRLGVSPPTNKKRQQGPDRAPIDTEKTSSTEGSKNPTEGNCVAGGNPESNRDTKGNDLTESNTEPSEIQHPYPNTNNATSNVATEAPHGAPGVAISVSSDSAEVAPCSVQPSRSSTPASVSGIEERVATTISSDSSDGIPGHGELTSSPTPTSSSATEERPQFFRIREGTFYYRCPGCNHLVPFSKDPAVCKVALQNGLVVYDEGAGVDRKCIDYNVKQTSKALNGNHGLNTMKKHIKGCHGFRKIAALEMAKMSLTLEDGEDVPEAFLPPLYLDRRRKVGCDEITNKAKALSKMTKEEKKEYANQKVRKKREAYKVLAEDVAKNWDAVGHLLSIKKEQVPYHGEGFMWPI